MKEEDTKEEPLKRLKNIEDESKEQLKTIKIKEKFKLKLSVRIKSSHLF